MKIFVSVVFALLIVGNCCAMEEKHWYDNNPYALLAVEDGDEGDEATSLPAAHSGVTQTLHGSIPPTPASSPVSSVVFLRLHRAVESGDLSEVRRILDDPFFNVNEQDVRKNTALHLALELEDVECAHLIVQKRLRDIDRTLRNDRGMTVIDCAQNCFPLHGWWREGRPLEARVYGERVESHSRVLVWACQIKTSGAAEYSTYIFGKRDKVGQNVIELKVVGGYRMLVFNHERQDLCLLLNPHLFLRNRPISNRETWVWVQPLKLIEVINWLWAGRIC